jgi:hydrogenase nickel incorporation protein HypA/HybF
MHELGITQELIDTVLASARRAEASRVERVVLRIGPQAGVDPESIQFAFQVLARGTIAADAIIELEADPTPTIQGHELIAGRSRALAVVAIEVD